MSVHAAHVMSDREWLDLNRRARAGLPPWEMPLLGLAALGVVGLLIGLGGQHRSLQAFWVNFLFWGGLAQAGVVFAAIVHLTRGQWGPTLVRLALLQVAFVPVTLLLFVVVAASAPVLLPWADAEVRHEIQTHFPFKAAWLSVPFFIVRGLVGLGALAAVSVAFARAVLRPERGALAELSGVSPPQGWRGLEAERAHSRRRATALAIAVVVLYVLVYTLLSFDLVMSLEPEWYSTLFGGHFFVTTIYMGLAALIVWAALLRRRLGLETQLGPYQFHNVGKILFGFCVLSAYTFFSQYLVIWYGNLPEETSFIRHRIEHPVWLQMAKAVIFGGFAIPFVILINQRVKMIPATLAAVAVLVLAAGLIERSLLVLPPLRPGVTRLPSEVVGLPEILVTLGFAGLYGFTVLWSLRRGIAVPPDWRVPPFAH